MKLTTKLVTNDGKFAAKDVTYLDLSELNITNIESLDGCVNLRHLILRYNDLNCLIGLEKCRQLWRLDVCNNKIKNLDGLNKFVAVGTLNLHGNDYNWTELEKIRHLHVIDLVCSSNPKLERDPNYRLHLIDCLPYVWMIDGLLVTSAERQEVADFFQDSALTTRPVRKKLPKYQFIPSDLKKRDVYGEWSTNLLSKFPVNEIKNVETDLRKLEFLSSWFEDVILSECKHYRETVDDEGAEVPEFKREFLKELLEYRKTNTEMCNMILVLLIVKFNFFFDSILCRIV